MSDISVHAAPARPADRGRRLRHGPLNYAFVLPAVLLFVIFVAYPILWVAAQSFLAPQQGGGTGFAGFQNYLAIFRNPVFWTVVVNMLLWGFITIPVQMLVGGVVAYHIETYTRTFRTFFRTMFFLPVVTSVSVVSLVWAQIYAPYYGIAQHYLSYLGVGEIDSLLGNPRTAIYALIIVNIWQWTGFSMLMYVAGLVNLPREILEAATIDGASGFRLARHIIVPLLRPVTKSLVLLGVIGTLQTFPIVHLMTTGGPNYASEVFGTFIFRQGFIIGDTHGAAALSVIVLIIALVATLGQIFLLGGSFGGRRTENANG